MKIIPFILVVTALTTLTQNARAQIIAPYTGINSNKKTSVSGSFASSSVDYMFEDTKAEIERKILALGVISNLSAKVSLLAQLGYIIDSEVNPGSINDGKGFILGLGAQGSAWKQNNLGARWYALFTYLNEDLEANSSTKFDLNMTEFHLGGVFFITIENNFCPYLGLEIIPYNDGTLEYKEGNSSTDVERDDLLNMHLGFTAEVESLELGLDIATGGEQSFIFSVGKKI